MTEIKEGCSYIAKSFKQGENVHGKWEMLIVKGQGKRQPTIAVSVINVPCGLGPTGAFRIDHIASVMHRMWRTPDGEFHYGNVTVRAEVTPIYDIGMQTRDVINQIGGDDVEFTTEFRTFEDWLSQ